MLPLYKEKITRTCSLPLFTIYWISPPSSSMYFFDMERLRPVPSWLRFWLLFFVQMDWKCVVGILTYSNTSIVNRYYHFDFADRSVMALIVMPPISVNLIALPIMLFITWCNILWSARHCNWLKPIFYSYEQSFRSRKFLQRVCRIWTIWLILTRCRTNWLFQLRGGIDLKILVIVFEQTAYQHFVVVTVRILDLIIAWF